MWFMSYGMLYIILYTLYRVLFVIVFNVIGLLFFFFSLLMKVNEKEPWEVNVKTKKTRGKTKGTVFFVFVFL